MFCQLIISNNTWQSSSIKVLQKKKFVGSFEWNSCQQGSGLERSLQCTMCKSANVLMCKSSRDGSELKKTLQICKSANVWMCKSSRDGSELKRTLQIVQPNIDLVASTHFLQTFSAQRQRENLALKLVRWLEGLWVTRRSVLSARCSQMLWLVGETEVQPMLCAHNSSDYHLGDASLVSGTSLVPCLD